MGRLRCTADVNDKQVVRDLLEVLDSNVKDLKDTYYVLLENLNALSKDYSGVYNELKVMCKLPNKNDVNDIVQFQSDISKAKEMFNDDNFLSNFIK